MHAGMSYKRLEALAEFSGHAMTKRIPAKCTCHSRLWQEPLIGPRAPFHAVEFEPPVDELNEQFPIRLTTGRHLDSYNTGRRASDFLRRSVGGRRLIFRQRMASATRSVRAKKYA